MFQGIPDIGEILVGSYKYESVYQTSESTNLLLYNNIILNISAQRCKSRWLNMRDQFRRVLRLRIEQPDEYTNKRYRYEEELQFMIPNYKLHKIEENRGKRSTKRDRSSSDDDSINSDMNDLIQPDFEASSQSITYKTQETNQNTDSLHVELNPTDPLDVFLMTIGNSLKSFNPYHLNQAKSKIFQICQDYELQQISGKPGFSEGKG